MQSNEALVQKSKLTPEKLALLKRTICRGSTDDEFELFVAVCNRTGLDPFTRQIHAVKRRIKDPDTGEYEDVLVHQTGIDGYRLTAERSKKYAGQDPIMWCGPDGVWVDVWLHEEPPMAAKAGVYREGVAEPFTNVALYSAYVQRNAQGVPVARWAADPAGMLGKCAEAGAIRKAFPNEVADIYTNEEMGQLDNPAGSPTVQQPQRASARKVEASNVKTTTKTNIGNSPFVGVVAKLSSETGGGGDTGKKEWRRYDVFVAKPGSETTYKLGTFDKGIAEVAKTSAEAGEEVKFHFEKKGKFLTLTGIEAIADGDGEPED